jgi:hypothetical protein
MVTLNIMFDDFTAHTCWFLMAKDNTLRINFSTPIVNKFEQLVITQSFSQPPNHNKFDNSATSEWQGREKSWLLLGIWPYGPAQQQETSSAESNCMTQ